MHVPKISLECITAAGLQNAPPYLSVLHRMLCAGQEELLVLEAQLPKGVDHVRDLAKWHDLWLHSFGDEHPFATHFDVHQGYRVFDPQPSGDMLVLFPTDPSTPGHQFPQRSQGVKNAFVQGCLHFPHCRTSKGALHWSELNKRFAPRIFHRRSAQHQKQVRHSHRPPREKHTPKQLEQPICTLMVSRNSCRN